MGGVGWGGWYDAMCVINDFLDDGVVSPLGVVFLDIYCFPNIKVIGGEMSFPLFLEFFWEIASMFCDSV